MQAFLASAVTCSPSADLRSQLNRLGGVDYASCDAGDGAKLDAAVEAWAGGSAVHGLVLAAGVSIPAQAGISEVERFNETVAANLGVPFSAAAGLRARLTSGSSVVFISSINALQAFPDNPGYVAAKSALVGVARALALDWAPARIRVNALAYGYFPTDMTAQSYAEPDARAERSARTMLGRWGDLDEAVGPALFLLSRASSYITGQVITVDGGWTAKGL